MTGDFNGDGRLDIAAGDQTIDPTTGDITDGVSVLLGNGDGTFQSPVDYAVGGAVTSLAVGDFNGDGRLDIAAGYQTVDPRRVLPPAACRCCWATATGRSGAPSTTRSWAGVTSLAVGDFNGDGRPDIAAGIEFRPTRGLAAASRCCWATATGRSRAPSTTRLVETVASLAVGDFNGDGRLDIAAGYGDFDPTTRSVHSGGVSVLLGDGDGMFRSPVNYAVGGRRHVPGGGGLQRRRPARHRRRVSDLRPHDG